MKDKVLLALIALLIIVVVAAGCVMVSSYKHWDDLEKPHMSVFDKPHEPETKAQPQCNTYDSIHITTVIDGGSPPRITIDEQHSTTCSGV